MDISPEAVLPLISIRENRMSFAYGAGPNIGSDSNDPFRAPPEVVVEHNIFENAFRGIGGGFAGVGNVTYRHNLHRNAVSGSGVQVYHPNNDISYNLFEYTFEQSVQINSARPDIVAMRGPANTTFRYNTVRYAGWDSGQGESSTIVEFNNFIASPQWDEWGWWWGLGMPRSSGLVARMSNNWWGTPDLQVVRSHIADSNNTTLEYAGNLNPVIVEPILMKPNGIGFVRGRVIDKSTGRPVSEAAVQAGDVAFHSNVASDFFAALPEGPQTFLVTTIAGKTSKTTLTVTAGETLHVVVELPPDTR